MRANITVEIDIEIYEYLKERVKAFGDTPNSVLRRELLGEREVPDAGGTGQEGEVPPFPAGTPKAIQQILQVVTLVRRDRLPRGHATVLVARFHNNVARNTVHDKYFRQLGLNVREFDKLLDEPSLSELQQRLLGRFPREAALIRKVVSEVKE